VSFRTADFIAIHLKSLANKYTPIIFRFPSTIKCMTSTRSTRFWLGFFQNSVICPPETRIVSFWTADFIALHSQSILHIHPFTFYIPRMINGITSMWPTRFGLGFFPELVFGHLPTRNCIASFWTFAIFILASLFHFSSFVHRLVYQSRSFCRCRSLTSLVHFIVRSSPCSPSSFKFRL
jgi:hypothetical protein